MATDNTDVRLTRTGNNAAGRAPRSTADDARTGTDGTALSKAERQKLLRDEFRQEALPAAPKLVGFHTCWLSSTSTYDPLHKRIRMGYQPVRVDEVPGLESFKMTTGQFEGYVACNEMLLFKIPDELYLEVMTEFHHDAPMREEEAIKASLQRGEVDSGGAELDGQVEGFDDLAIPKRPLFSN
jgi:hypothetical protein